MAVRRNRCYTTVLALVLLYLLLVVGGLSRRAVDSWGQYHERGASWGFDAPVNATASTSADATSDESANSAAVPAVNETVEPSGEHFNAPALANVTDAAPPASETTPDAPAPINTTASPSANKTTSGGSPFDEYWSKMKQTLCPNMVPNPTVWTTLFELARRESGAFHEEKIPASAYPKNKKWQWANFYKFNFGGLGYDSGGGQYTTYLRIFKAGNDQIRFNLLPILDKSGGEVWEGIDIAGLFDRIPKSGLNNTCVVTAIRDPISHFLSAYNEVETRRHVRNLPDEQKRPYERRENGTAARFEQFVTTYIGGPRSSGMYMGKRQGIEEITHIFAMSGILWGFRRIKDCYGTDVPQTVTYLPSLANLDEEFPKLLHENCPGLPPFGPFRREIKHESQSDEFHFYSAAKQAWAQQGNISRALCVLHAPDYACFDALSVPPLCQDVYMQPSFRDKMQQASSAKPPAPACGRGHYGL
ncbi:hypothetical protein ACHAXT_006040 [Thalassiosira profunda]